MRAVRACEASRTAPAGSAEHRSPWYCATGRVAAARENSGSSAASGSSVELVDADLGAGARSTDSAEASAISWPPRHTPRTGRAVDRTAVAMRRAAGRQPRGDVVLPRGHGAAEHDEAVDVVGQLGRDGLAGVGAEHDELDADLLPPLAEQRGRVGRVVLDDEQRGTRWRGAQALTAPAGSARARTA